MRTIKELLIELKKFYINSEVGTTRKSRYSGLCHAVRIMTNNYKITRYEARELFNYIDNHKPLFYILTKKLLWLRCKGYYWELYKMMPRIDWLDKQIRKL